MTLDQRTRMVQYRHTIAIPKMARGLYIYIRRHPLLSYSSPPCAHLFPPWTCKLIHVMILRETSVLCCQYQMPNSVTPLMYTAEKSPLLWFCVGHNPNLTGTCSKIKKRRKERSFHLHIGSINHRNESVTMKPNDS